MILTAYIGTASGRKRPDKPVGSAQPGPSPLAMPGRGMAEASKVHLLGDEILKNGGCTFVRLNFDPN